MQINQSKAKLRTISSNWILHSRGQYSSTLTNLGPGARQPGTTKHPRVYPLIQTIPLKTAQLLSCLTHPSSPVLSHSVLSDSLRPHGLQPTRLLCPWNSPGRNTGVGCHFLLQGIFPTQGSNSRLLHLLHWQAASLPLSHLGSLHPSFLGKPE